MMSRGFAPKGNMSNDRKSMIHLCPTCLFKCEDMNCDGLLLDGKVEDEVYECEKYEEE
jgi:hypothetical protein